MPNLWKNGLRRLQKHPNCPGGLKMDVIHSAFAIRLSMIWVGKHLKDLTVSLVPVRTTGVMGFMTMRKPSKEIDGLA
jgi:hypothetical protein